MQKPSKILGLWLTLMLASGCSKAPDNATKYKPEPASPLPQTAPVSKVTSSSCAIGAPNFVALVKEVDGSVVNVSAEIKPRERNVQFPGLSDDDPWSQLFKRFGMAPQQQSPSKAFGSGFIISSDGYILTNAHVVNQATNIQIRLNNKQQFPAKLIGLDVQTDIALLKIDATGLTAAKIGNPDQLEVGEWVVAIGAPFGLDNTVTAGIVSAKGRNLPSENYVPFIQTDVAINPGNSGGPLFNTSGEVVGINSQIYSRSGGFMGISFSIPIDVAEKIAEQLKAHGKVYHGQLGIQIQEVTPELAKSFGLGKVQGALVANVITGSKAAAAGVQAGDVITAVDGKVIENASDLPILISSKKPGESVKLTIVRAGKTIELTSSLGGSTEQEANDDEQTLPKSNPKAEVSANIAKFGLKVLSVNDPQVAGRVQSKSGVVVISSEGVAAMAGLSPGDVILMVNNKAVTGVAQLNSLLANTRQVALLVERGNQRMYVSISLG